MKNSLIASFFVAALSAATYGTPLMASETSTNWNWASLKLTLSQTNFYVGEKIPVGLVVSNISQSEHRLWQYAGDPCLFGPGKIIVTDLTSNREIVCKFTLEERASWGWVRYYDVFLHGNKFKVFETDLTKGFALTNSGLYSIKMVASFQVAEAQTNSPGQFTNIITPPILIRISSKKNNL
jgi:hypothetical protein